MIGVSSASPLRAAALATTVACVAFAPTAIASAPAVTGKVAGGAGYTLILLPQNGQALSVKLTGAGAFSFPASRSRGAGLHLISPKGRYFGPVVLSARRGRVLTTLSGRPAKLGAIRLKSGYAVAAKGAKAASSAAWAYADTRGKPVGAGRLGLVRVAAGRAGRARAAQYGGGGQAQLAGSDSDHDGIPQTFDAADNPQGTLDATTAGSAGDGLFSFMGQSIGESANVNAGTADPAKLDRLLHDNLDMNFYLDSHAAGGAAVSAVNLDCGELPYCSPHSAEAQVDSGSNNSAGVPAGADWSGLDADGDGLPNVPALPGRPDVWALAFHPSVAGSSEIAPGDVYQIKYTTPGGPVVLPTSLTLYFQTVPALATYDDGDGPVNIDYADQQSLNAPLALSSGSLTVSFWRPQRAALPGESTMKDMGGLHYGFPLNVGNQEVGCGAAYYTNLSPTLAASTSSADSMFNGLFPLKDSAADQTPDAANRLSFTIDIAGCLSANGVDPAGRTLDLSLTAVDESRRGGTDRAVQMFRVQLP